ncbi:acyl carrier protein [Dolichospermum circinale CS-545/17]|uniref:Acyl carrier protein n=1 Tax=Dolichospermum circinale CS-537/01 TaxID=3021739 RepID=A0ABT5A251_9CYAN|nr:acyl carrier protein [Dolichospermum circinale]MDB9458662.1 acyl carrier protein [Dolichospermum circinale CS-545/17]MDB9486005.1 acyl carrier protein [Dolichospermum circinale CS-537/01]
MKRPATNSRLPEEFKRKLRSIVRSYFDLEESFPIKDGTMIVDFPGVDSFSVMDILARVEIEFYINIGFGEIDNVRTMDDLYSLVANKIRRGA